MSDEIVVDRSRLEQVTRRFAQQEQAIAQLRQTVRGAVGEVLTGWAGESADAFKAEVTEQILPALERLSEALHSARQTALAVDQVMQSAEEEGAAGFSSHDSSPTTMPTEATDRLSSGQDRSMTAPNLPVDTPTPLGGREPSVAQTPLSAGVSDPQGAPGNERAGAVAPTPGPLRAQLGESAAPTGAARPEPLPVASPSGEQAGPATSDPTGAILAAMAPTAAAIGKALHDHNKGQSNTDQREES